jgi:hypothetical protein
VLLGCAALLAAGQFAVGSPRRALPDLVWLAVVSLAPLVLATRIIKTPGAASAVCGAYLLPRTLITLVDASVEPPPLLLVPALAFDLSAWLRRGDLLALRHLGSKWHRRDRRPRRISLVRAASAGALFGLVLALAEPPFAVFLGGDPSAWSVPQVWLAGALSTLACAVIGLSARDTRS